MCYQLVLVSPLTLSEVRAMLPPGVRADALDPAEQPRFRALLHGSQTAVALRAGACACALVRPAAEPAAGREAHLRARYRALRVPRTEVIPALERHRRAAPEPPGLEPPAARLAAFVAEHARNAGPTVYALAFAPHDAPVLPDGLPHATVHLRDVRPEGGWLREDAVVRVVR